MTTPQTEASNAMTSAGQIVAALEAEATFVDEGEFSVDWQQAVRLMGSHALADSREWLPLVLQAGGLLGASTIQVTGGRSEVEVYFEQLTLSREELLEPLRPLTRDPADRRQNGLRKLARAQATLLAMSTERIELRVHDGLSAVYTQSEKHVEAGKASSTKPGATLRVTFGGAPDQGRMIELARLLEERCQFSNVPTSLRDQRVDRGWNAAFDGTVPTVEILDSSGKPVGRAGFRADESATAKLLIQSGGVLIEQVPLPESGAGFVAIVDLELPVDLSQRKVVRNQDFETMLAWVHDAHQRAPRVTPDARLALEREHRQSRERQEQLEEAEDAEQMDSQLGLVLMVLAFAGIFFLVFAMNVCASD